MAHFGVMGIKYVVLIDNFEMVILLQKEDEKEPEEGDESSQEPQTKVVSDLVKLEENDRARNMIILHIGDRVLRSSSIVKLRHLCGQLLLGYISQGPC